jgi:hypothetical protein
MDERQGRSFKCDAVGLSSVPGIADSLSMDASQGVAELLTNVEG